MNDSDVLEDYGNGLGIRDLVTKYHTSQSKIYGILKRNNVQIRPSGGRKASLTDEQVYKIITKYKDGEILKNLEKEFKTSKERIKEILKENNVPIRTYNKNYKYIEEGTKFWKLTFLEEIKERKNKKIQWLVRCECGNQKVVLKPDVLSGKTKTCGCGMNQGYKKEEDRENIVAKTLFSEYRKSARVRGYEFNISFDKFKELIISSKCYYCGSNESRQRKDESTNFVLSYMGIDRLMNDIGYVDNNIVPCCSTCNYMKKDMDVDVFLNLIKIIYKNRKLANDADEIS